TLVSTGQQYIGDRTECDLLSTQLAERQARCDFPIPGAVVAIGILGPVVVNAVDKQEQVAKTPAADMLEGDCLLGLGVDLEIIAVQVGQAVVLPLQGGSG